MNKRLYAALLAAAVMLQCAEAAPVAAGSETVPAAGISDSGGPGPGKTEQTEKPGQAEDPEQTGKPGQTEGAEESEAPGFQAHVHVWDREEVSREPTCTEDGNLLIICSACGAVRNEAVPAAHTPGKWKTERDATCAQFGKKVRLCEICGETVGTEMIPMKEHVWGEWQRLCDATLYNPGQEWCRCSACGQTRTRSVSEKLAAGLILTPMEVTMKVGESGRMIRAGSIAAGDAVISWKSGNPRIASVTPQGRITAKKEGRTTITVTLASGMSVKARVIVKGIVKTRKITKVPAKITLKKGKKRTLHPKLEPSNSVQKITYSSSDKKVAKVNKKGRITARKKGTAVITVKSGSKIVKCLVKVK